MPLKEFSYRGHNLQSLEGMSMDEFIICFHQDKEEAYNAA
jgi:hypothetical protein